MAIGFAFAVVSGVVAFALAMAYEMTQPSGQSPTGVWTVAASAVGIWEAPSLVIAHFVPQQRRLAQLISAEESSAGALTFILSTTIGFWTIVVGGVHRVWTRRWGNSGHIESSDQTRTDNP
jgi:hypothetical protein